MKRLLLFLKTYQYHIFKILAFNIFFTILLMGGLVSYAQPQLTAEWAKAGKGANRNIGKAVDIDNNGNVYVAGRYESFSFDLGDGVNLTNPFDAKTQYVAKYDADGNTLWARTIGDPNPNNGNTLTHIVAIAVNPQTGDIYLTGMFQSATLNLGNGIILANKGNWDMFLIKLNTDGVTQWAVNPGGSKSDSGKDITISKNGDIYILGNFASSALQLSNSQIIPNINSMSEDYVLIRYDDAGNVLWVNNYSGNGLYLAVDGANNIFCITKNTQGQNKYLMKIDSNGNQGNSVSIVFDYMNPGFHNLTADEAGNVYLSNTDDQSTHIIKYDNSLNFLWQSTSISPSASIRDLAIDQYGNLIIMGHFSGKSLDFGNFVTLTSQKSGFKTDIYVAGYYPNGVAKWAGLIKQTGDGVIDSKSLAVDQTGFLYVTGEYGSTSLNFGNNVALPTSVYSDLFVGKLKIPVFTSDLLSVLDDKAVCTNCIPSNFPLQSQSFNIEMSLWREGSSDRDKESYTYTEGEFVKTDVGIEIPLPKGLRSGEHFIKIRALLKDGSYTKWSEAVGFEVEGKAAEELLSIYPNPFVKDVNLSYQSQNNDEVTVELTDANTGKLLLQENFEAYEGENEWQLAVPYSPSEIVILKLYSKTQKPIMKKLMRRR